MTPSWVVGVIIAAGYPLCFSLGYMLARDTWMGLYSKLADRYAIKTLAAKTWEEEVEILAKKVAENEDEQG